MLPLMRSFHCIRLSGLVLVTAVAFLQAGTAVSAQAPATANFSVFQRGVVLGSEEISVVRTGSGVTITSSGRLGAPIDLVLRSLQIRYDAEWKPIDLVVDATLRQQPAVLKTTVNGNVATTELSAQTATPVINTGEIHPQALLLVNPYVAPYEAVAARVATAQTGTELPLYQPGGASGTIKVGESTTEQIQTLSGLIRAKRTRLEAASANGPSMMLEIWGDENGRLLRVSSPTQQIEFVREDLASVSSRVVTMTRANDEDVLIPANGFSLAGTLSKPAALTNQPSGTPAVVLLSGSSPTDRDESIAGIPIFAQLAGAIADAGFFALRYDKRGVGQSGGRPDAAALTDFAEDARAAVRFLSERKDVDRRRIAVIGHSEGGWIALLTAKDNGRVAAVGLLSTNGTTGADLNLYQVARRYERGNRPDMEKTTALELQKQIQAAVVSGKGWETIRVPPATRAQADTPYFQSFLTLNPAALMKDVDQPLLIVAGELDRQLPPTSAETLAALAKARKKAAPVEVVKIPGVNHLLVSATTGEMDEYGTLSDRRVNVAALSAVTAWLQKTLRAR